MNLSISEADKPLLLEFFRSREAQLEVEMQRVRSNISMLQGVGEEQLNGVRGEVSQPAPVAPVTSHVPNSSPSPGLQEPPKEKLEDLDYDDSWNWTQKVSYFLNRYGKLTTAQIAQHILDREPTLSKKLIHSSLSSNLTSAVKKGKKYDRYKKDENSEYEYWLKPKQENTAEPAMFSQDS